MSDREGALDFKPLESEPERRKPLPGGRQISRLCAISPLNLRIVKPRSVLVEVTDPDGKQLRLEVPWKR